MEMMRLNQQEKWYLVLGCFTSTLIGGILVVSNIIYAEIYSVRVLNLIGFHRRHLILTSSEFGACLKSIITLFGAVIDLQG